MVSQVVIRKALPEDIGQLTGLLNILFSIEADFSPDESKQRRGLELMLADPEQRCALVAEYQGEIIGMCTAQLLISTAEGGKAALIEDVVVTERFRDNGIGQELMSAIEEWANNQDVKRLELLADRANTPALEFYRKNNWHQTQLVCFHKK